MTDYQVLIARAVAGLEKNTGEARRTLYERARTALVDQLRGLDPPLSESEITQQRLALEESIRKVESEAARRPRVDPRRVNPTSSAKSGDTAPKLEEPAKEPNEREAKPRRSVSSVGGVAAKPEREEAPAVPVQPQIELPAPRNARGARSPSDRAPAASKGLKSSGDATAEAEALGEATAQAAKSARRAYAAAPSDVPLERIESRGPRSPSREPPDRPANKPAARGNGSTLDAGEAFHGSTGPQALPSSDEAVRDEDIARRERSSLRGLGSAAIAVLVILGLGATFYWQRDRIRGLLVRNPPLPTHQETARPQTKIPDRVTQGTGTSATGQTASPDQNVAPVAQRVVLYEEDPADPQGKRYVGSVIWNGESVSPGPGQPPEMTVRANLEIPERRINMTMSVRRNTDKALPASHTVEIVFNLPPDFPFGGIANVPGVLMKQAEQTRGAPLAGLAVKVTSGYFLLGLSSTDTDMQRNLQLLKERSWFDIPIVYGNGRRAILAVEKGTPGERAFNEAFAAWGE